jgi:hypothetical protein
MKTKALLFALLAVALAACNNGNPQDQKAVEPESTAIQATNDNLPKKDIITDDGLGEFQLGATIPETHPDYDIKAVVSVDEEEMEEVSFEFSKDGEVQFTIFPAYIDETDAQSNEIGGIMVVSDQFTHNGIGVGSNVNDILKANPNLEVTFYDDQYFRINDGGITYLISSEAYDGLLPEVPFDIPAPVENPTFKPDAKVSSIWIHPTF